MKDGIEKYVRVTPLDYAEDYTGGAITSLECYN